MCSEGLNKYNVWGGREVVEKVSSPKQFSSLLCFF